MAATEHLVTIRDTCRCCGSSALACSVPLAEAPIVSPNVGSENGAVSAELLRIVAPLDTYLCPQCGLIQLVHIVDPALIYRHYLYRTSVSAGMEAHFQTLCSSVIERLGCAPGNLVVEFGSNDGTLLRCFKDAGMTVVGVDPAEAIAAEATKRGVPTRADFFGRPLAEDILAEHGAAKVVLANNVLANIDDLGDILEGVAVLLAPDGAFVFETQYALDVFEKNLLDVVYHEHISCFSVKPVARTFGRYALELFDVERIPTKGGSIRFWLQPAGGPRKIERRVEELIDLETRTGLYDLAYHRRFGERTKRNKTALHEMIRTAKKSRRPIAGYGTSVGSAALIHQFALEDHLDFLLDDNPFKDRLQGPGYSLPVYRGASALERNPALIVILAWRYAEPIVAKHAEYIEKGGRFVVPLPDVVGIPQAR